MTAIGVDVTATLPIRDVVLLAQYADVCGLDSVWISERSGRDIGIEAALVATGTERIHVGLHLAEPSRGTASLMALATTLEDAAPGRILLGALAVPGTAISIESQVVLVYGASAGQRTRLDTSDLDPAADGILLTSAGINEVLNARRWINSLPPGARQPRIIARLPSSEDVTEVANHAASMFRSGVGEVIFVPRADTASVADAVRECIEAAVDLQEAIAGA